MSNKFLSFTLLLVAISIAVNSVITAKNTATLSIAPQLKEVLDRQERIQKRLVSIESRQREILNTIAKLKISSSGLAQRRSSWLEDFDKEYKIDIGNSPVKGNKDAKVTIVEFSDFQCPFSRRFHTVLLEVLKAYPEDVKIVFKNFPLSFHKQARQAAKASLAAGEQGKYWQMVELLFQNAGELNEEKYKELAGQLGLDVEKFMNDYKQKDAKWEKIIGEDIALGHSVNVRGTPTFYINGRKTKARDLESFKIEIDKILKEMKK
jgi:protein-disulfide isomerase